MASNVAMETTTCLVDSVAILVELTEKQRKDDKQRQDASQWDVLTSSVEKAVATGDSILAIKEVVKFVSAVTWDACHPKRGGAARRRDLTRIVLQWTNCERIVLLVTYSRAGAGPVQGFFCRSVTLLAVPAGLPLRALRAAPTAALPRLEVCVFVNVGGKCFLATADLNHRRQPGFGAQGQEGAPNGAQGHKGSRDKTRRAKTVHAAQEVQGSQAAIGAMGTFLICLKHAVFFVI